jgi:hypothetical protein
MLVPLVTVAESHYLTPEDRGLYDVLASMRTLTMLRQPHEEKLPAGGAYHFHTQEEMQRAFGHMPQALANTERIWRCQFEPPAGDLHFDFRPAGVDRMQMLRELCEAGWCGVGTPRRRRGALERGEDHQRHGISGLLPHFSDIMRKRTGTASRRWRGKRGRKPGVLRAGDFQCVPVPLRAALSGSEQGTDVVAKLADIDLDLPGQARRGSRMR